VFVRRWLILAVIVLAGCATAVDDQPTNLGVGPVDASSPGKDTGSATAKDTGASAPDTSFVEDTGSTVEDTSVVDPDTGSVDPDTGSVDPDTGTFDTGTPPLDTGPGGACMYCSTGSCPTSLSDYGCLFSCLLDGYLDCHYDPAASVPCTCKL
jgi:hypothetical protein